MGSQQFCLRWNNHQSAVMSGFSKLLENETLVDVTIACAGVRIKAHKVVLSACSPYFQEIFEENPCKHPVIILKGFTFQDLKSIIDFMYKGEVNVNQQNLADFLKMAEELQVSGLMDVPSHQHHHQQQQQQHHHHENDGRPTTTAAAARNHHQETTAAAATTESSRGTISVKEENDTNSGSSRDFVGRARDRIARTMKRSTVGDDYIQSVTATDETPIDHLDLTNDRLDSDDAIPICPVDAELHIKEEVELFDDEEEDESSRLLLERLTRPQATSSGRHNVEQTASNVSSYDLATASSSHDLPPTVEMLESLPGHSSWNVTQISHDGEPAPKILKRRKKRRSMDSANYCQAVDGSSMHLDTLSSSTADSKLLQMRQVAATLLRIKNTGKTPVKCQYCPQIFSSSTNRNRHIKHMHFLKPNERNFACSLCDRAYRRKDNLTYHLRLCHPDHPIETEVLRT